MTHKEKQISRRVFLALWPDDNTRQSIYRIQRQLGTHTALESAVPVAVQNLHLTLHFLGSVSEDVFHCISESLEKIDSPVIELTIDHVGRFPKPGILWLGIKNIPGALDTLVSQTGQCVSACVESYQQKSFRPHITLFRKARHDKDLTDIAPVNWRASSFVLVESKTWAEGVEYRVLKEWPLRY